MDKTNGEYLAPEVKVVEMQPRQQLLQMSTTSLEDIDRRESLWD